MSNRSGDDSHDKDSLGLGLRIFLSGRVLSYHVHGPEFDPTSIKHRWYIHNPTEEACFSMWYNIGQDQVKEQEKKWLKVSFLFSIKTDG